MMRAKFTVQSVNRSVGFDQVKFTADYSSSKEDNTYAQATPCANCDMTISNPALLGQLQPGDKFYVDFTKIEKPVA